jgi:hypothetical protein
MLLSCNIGDVLGVWSNWQRLLPFRTVSKQLIDVAARCCDAKHLIHATFARLFSMKTISYPLFCILRANANGMQLGANGWSWRR